MKVSVIVIGDELLIGQVVDTNSGFIGRHIAPAGWEVADVQVVADDAGAISQAIERAFQTAPVVLTTGGLGPTKDDITKSVLCRYFGGSLRQDESVLENVKAVVAARGFRLNDLTAAQAMVPTSARIIQNRVGTAPIMWFELHNPEQVLVAMPGVPFETRQMFADEVFPQLLEKFPSKDAVAHRTVMVEGITESDLATLLAPWEESLPPHIHLAYLPKPGMIRLRIDAHGRDAEALRTELDTRADELIALCGRHFFYDGDAAPEEILLEKLISGHLTVGSAESCTGGNIAHLITSVAGSSAAMLGAVVAYSNDVKHRVLGVEEATLAHYGAVSEPVVCQMAEGARRALGCDVAMATSGIAGPGGGTPEKPVGTVCIAVAAPSGVKAATFHFPGNRERVIDRASATAIIMAVRAIAD